VLSGVTLLIWPQDPEGPFIETASYETKHKHSAESKFEPAQRTSYELVQIRIRGVNMIIKVKGGYKILSENGRNLGGPYKTKAAAEKRLRQVEFFKRRKG
jgi:hypothetical protein